MSFYKFDESAMKYYLKPEYSGCNVQLYYTFIPEKEPAGKKLWDTVEQKVLKPNKDGCFMSLESDSFIKHTKVMCYYFGLIENDIYSNVINQHSHIFETYDIYSQQYGVVISYTPQTYNPIIKFSRRYCKNILASFEFVTGETTIKSSKFTIGLSGCNILDNHISDLRLPLDLSLICDYLYQYFVIENWNIRIRIESKLFSSTDAGAKGEFKLINNTTSLYMNIFSKNIIRAFLIQRTHKITIHNLINKIQYKSPSQLFVTNETDNIDTEANACVVYIDLLNNVRCYNVSKKKISNFQYILITTPTEMNQNVRVTLYSGANSSAEALPISTFHLYDKTCLWVFRLDDSRAFSWYIADDTSECSKVDPKNNFCDVTKFVNDFRSPVCLL